MPVPQNESQATISEYLKYFCSQFSLYLDFSEVNISKEIFKEELVVGREALVFLSSVHFSTSLLY